MHPADFDAMTRQRVKVVIVVDRVMMVTVMVVGGVAVVDLGLETRLDIAAVVFFMVFLMGSGGDVLTRHCHRVNGSR